MVNIGIVGMGWVMEGGGVCEDEKVCDGVGEGGGGWGW